MPATCLYDLLTAAAAGDETSFRELFHRYKQQVYAYAMHFTRSEAAAEEIVQDVFLKLWLHKEGLHEIARFEAYIYTMTRNRCFDHLKKLANERAVEQEWSRRAGLSEENTERTIIYKDVEGLIHQALEQLPPQQKKIYILSRYQGQKQEAIARHLHISENTVRSHLTKALGSIRHYLDIHLKTIILLLYVLLFH